MKKMLSVVALSMVLLLPMGAKAIKLSPIGDKCETEASCPDADGYCYATCGVKISENTTPLSSVDWSIVGNDNIEVLEINATPEGATVPTGNSKTVKVNFAVPMTDAEFNLATYRIKYKNDVDCSHRLNFNGVDVPIEVTKPEPVKTGATLPLVIIACGAGAAFVIYLATKKNKKMYKI